MLDNASDDGSVAAVRERFPRVRVIEQRHRAGFGENNNAIIRATTSRYVYLLNPDTTSDDWGLERMTAYLDAHPRVAAIGPRLVWADGRPQDSAFRFPTPAVAALSLLTLSRLGVVQSRGNETREVDWATAAALLVRREALDEVGLFDEEIFMYSEETDLCARLRAAGWGIEYFPAVTVVHHQPWSESGVPERRINEQWRGRHRYWEKHHSAAGARAAALFTGAQYALRGLIRRVTTTSRRGCACTRTTRFASRGQGSASSPRSGTARRQQTRAERVRACPARTWLEVPCPYGVSRPEAHLEPKCSYS